MDQPYRIAHDSMGEVRLPLEAAYGAQTQRAIDNFGLSDLKMPRRFIQALGLIKSAAAIANEELGLLAPPLSKVIQEAAARVITGAVDAQFPVDVFQTGSGTSSNMNANEVIAHLANQIALNQEPPIHPNDHVNMGQSSNDTIPTAIHLSAALALKEELLPALSHLQQSIEQRAKELANITKTGRTHLMDAMPVTLGQELSGWAQQIALGIERIQASLPRLVHLAIGGTAVGTGINAHPKLSPRIVSVLKEKTGIPFQSSPNFFESLSCQDTAVEISGQLKVIAVSLMKIANDLRWMNSGPLAGFSEIALPNLQPGSSIMPGKVNPVIPEAVTMVCAQVIGNDTTITIAGQSGNFQLNVMLPVIAYNLLQSISLLAAAARKLADKAILGFTINTKNLEASLSRNPILVTALNSVIGYELGAKIAKTAYAEQRPLLEVAKEMTSLSEAELKRLLDPIQLTKGGIPTAHL